MEHCSTKNAPFEGQPAHNSSSASVSPIDQHVAARLSLRRQAFLCVRPRVCLASMSEPVRAAVSARVTVRTLPGKRELLWRRAGLVSRADPGHLFTAHQRGANVTRRAARPGARRSSNLAPGWGQPFALTQ